jgi:hypothetical protein
LLTEDLVSDQFSTCWQKRALLMRLCYSNFFAYFLSSNNKDFTNKFLGFRHFTKINLQYGIKEIKGTITITLLQDKGGE